MEVARRSAGRRSSAATAAPPAAMHSAGSMLHADRWFLTCMPLPHAAIIPQTALESPRNSENYLHVCVDARSGRFSIITTLYRKNYHK